MYVIFHIINIRVSAVPLYFSLLSKSLYSPALALILFFCEEGKTMRTIIVGDIHGCLLELEELLSSVKLNVKVDRLVLLGDLIDRGPNSAGVYLYVKTLQKFMQDRIVVIRGNHEDMFLSCYKNYTSHWYHMWGMETLESFERRNISPDVFASWIQNCTVLYYEDSLFQCAHGGLFYEELARNEKELLVWDRNAISTNTYDGKLTIIGHTPLDQASYGDGSMRPLEKLAYNRWYDLPKTGLIDIDTGCVAEDFLTAMIIDENRYKLVRQYPVYD